MADTSNISFENKIERVKEIVDKMENETLPLNESVSLFEEGQKLLKELEEELKKAEIRIKTIKEEKDIE